MVVRANTGLIGEVDGRALIFGGGPDRRVLLALPALDGLRILLISAVQRPLRREPELAQKPANAHHRQRHPEFPADHLADHLPGPQRELELHLPRILAHDQRVKTAQLRPGQLRRPARHRLGLQRAFPALAVFRQPPVDRLAVQPQRRGNILGMRALPDLLHRPDPQHLERLVVELAAVVVAHAPLSQITR